jgi:hypothetical protein
MKPDNVSPTGTQIMRSETEAENERETGNLMGIEPHRNRRIKKQTRWRCCFVINELNVLQFHGLEWSGLKRQCMLLDAN